MKIGALVIGLAASLLVAAVGLRWIHRHQQLQEGNERLLPLIAAAELSGDPQRMAGATEMRASLAHTDTLGRAGRLMAVLGAVSFVTTFLVFKLPKVSGTFMVAAALGPAVLFPRSLIFGVLLLLAALLAFLVKPAVTDKETAARARTMYFQ